MVEEEASLFQREEPVFDLVSGEESELARLVSRDDGEHGTRFRFQPAGFALAAAALLAARFVVRVGRSSRLGRFSLWSPGIVLLLGGLAIGALARPEAIESVAPLFFDLFKGVLALFLLEMGLIAATQASSTTLSAASNP